MVENGHRRLKIDGHKLLPATAEQIASVRNLLKQVARQQDRPDFFEVLDIARPVVSGPAALYRAGSGQGRRGWAGMAGSETGKLAIGSSLHSGLQHARWTTPAEQVVAIPCRMQAVSPALLQAVEMDGQSYVLRALQPSEDRIDLASAKGSIPHLQDLLSRLAQLTAWSQLRSSGREGSACADELIEYAGKRR